MQSSFRAGVNLRSIECESLLNTFYVGMLGTKQIGEMCLPIKLPKIDYLKIDYLLGNERLWVCEAEAEGALV